MANEYLISLQQIRTEWVEANRKNKFETGINNLLTELYPNNAHFIYELLQNAEDAGAHNVSFNLDENQIIFRHNGAKLFDENDVEGITSIGEGTKKNDINSIGKFGVGFKAVFSYTKSPKIYSGDFNFEIRNLVVPYEIATIKKNDSETVFNFPFDNDKKPQNIAYNEIKKGLLEINRITLLFLSNIENIKVQFENNEYLISKSEDDDSRIATIRNSQDNSQSNYLKFKKYLPDSDKLYVSIAFKVEKNKKTEKWMLQSIDRGEVAIFFPAEKESSNLKFHIHAPFSSTVARDSIKDLKVNNELIELISELICEAIEWIKENNYLNLYFLRCLPNNADNLSEFYQPIQEKIIELFNNEDYLPCDDENFHPANCCYRASLTVKKVIDISFLKVLNDIDDSEEIFWLKNPPQLNSREDKFIQLLEVEEFNEEEVLEKLMELADDYLNTNFDLVEKLNDVKDEYEYLDEPLSKKINEIVENFENQPDIIVEKLKPLFKKTKKYDEDYLDAIQDVINEYEEFNQPQIKRLIQDRNDIWIKIFYELLYSLIEKEKGNHYWFDKTKYSNLKLLIKLSDGSFNFENKGCYFSSQTSIKDLEKSIVNKNVYETDSQVKNQKSKQFLEYLGVKEISLEDEVNHILNEIYVGSGKITFDDNLQHIKLFLKYYEQPNRSYNSLLLFKTKCFLITSEKKLATPNQILIDEPWEKTNLKIISGDYRYLLNDFYFEKLTKNERAKFSGFLKEIGCHSTLPIESQDIYRHPNYSNLRDYYSKVTDYRINIDFDICSASKERFKNCEIDFSLLVWERMSSIKDVSFFTATYRANASSKPNTDASSLIYTLIEEIWVPDKKGVFHKPADISKDELHEKFKYNDENGWLTKIGFGKNRIQNKEELKKVDEILKNRLDFNLSTLEEAKSAGVTDEDIHRLTEEKKKKNKLQNSIPDLGESIDKHTRNIQPTNDKPNPDIIKDVQDYRDKAQSRLNKSIEKSRTEKRKYNTTVTVKVGKEETRQFLKNQYKGYCQICGFTFDQSGGKGKYFELFDWYSEKVIKQSSNIVDAGSTLCLCSRCHSVLKHGDFSPVFLNEIKDSGEPKFSDFIQHFENVKGDIEIPEVFRGIEFDLFKAPIRLLNKSEYIYYTEEHFLLFYNMLNLKDSSDIDSDIGFFEEEEKKQEEVIIIEVKKNNYTEIKKKSIVKIGDTVHIKYSNGNELKRKLVNYKPIVGSSETSITTPFGKMLIGKSVGNIFEMGELKIEILNIE
jgi:hypothetical protein